jgi:hypothetical protein
MSVEVTYPPLDVPKQVADDVWIVDSGPLKVAGVIPLPVRMTVLRLASGGFLLHSPIRFNFELRRRLEDLGTIEHLVAPNSAHWTFLEAWQRHVPDARTWAAPGLRERSQVKNSGVRLDQDLSPNPQEGWPEAVQQIHVPGIGGFCEVCLYHRGSGTLVLTDLIQNLEPGKVPLALRPIAALTGVLAPDGKAPIYLRAIVRAAGKDARAAGRRLIDLQPQRVIFAHGSWFQTEAASRLQRSLRWLA